MVSDFFLRHEKEGDGADDDNDDSDEDERYDDGEQARGVPSPQGQIFKDRGHRATATAGLLMLCGLCSSWIRISQPYA